MELLAVSKRHPASAVTEAMAAGQRRFGENRVQELSAKAAELGAVEGLGWHLIGSLQTNKVRELLRVPGLELVHSCDRAKLADALHRELAPSGRTLDVLLQVNATEEEQKHGCGVAEAPALRHSTPPCPGCSSTLWIVAPSGMFFSGRQLPSDGGASGPLCTWSPFFSPSGAMMYRLSPSE